MFSDLTSQLVLISVWWKMYQYIKNETTDLRKPRGLIPLLSLRKECSGVSTLELPRY